MGKIRNEIASVDIGENVMDNLKQLDEVAYIRFASVYRQFKDVETFKKNYRSCWKSKGTNPQPFP